MSLASNSSVAHQHQEIAFDGPIRTKTGTLANGQNLPAGTVLGRVTASGELVESDNGAANGSQVPVGVLVHAIDASGGATACQMYVSGDLNVNMLQWHSSWTAALQLGAFDGTPINLVTPN